MSDTKVPTIGPTSLINSLSFKLTDESDINLNNIFIWKNNTELVNVPDSVLKMVGYPLVLNYDSILNLNHYQSSRTFTGVILLLKIY